MASDPTVGVVTRPVLERGRPNPYVQVALTYVRRPLASWWGRIMSAVLVGAFVVLPLAEREETLRHSAFPLLVCLFCLFVRLASHMKGQFGDSRAQLMPSFRRIHATVAAIVALIAAVVLPEMLSLLAGRHSLGFVAVAAILFGAVLWVIVNDATWVYVVIAFAYVAVASTDWVAFYFQVFVAWHPESYAAVVFTLGILITLVAGIQLVRLKGDKLNDDSTLRWDWDWSLKRRQTWSGEGRILPGLQDWIRGRQMARATRLARGAGKSWWAHACRWQVGMVSGISLGLWILGVLVHVQALNWWMARESKFPAEGMMGVTSLILTFLPAVLTLAGALSWRTFKLRNELLLPVARSSYIRQLGTAAALSHFQLWAGMSMALALWWVLIGPRPFHLAVLGGVLAISAAFQVVIFGVAVWLARYRSPGLGVFVLLSLTIGFLVPLQLEWLREWSFVRPGQVPPEVSWISGILAVFGLLITYDAYRRWLVAEFD